LLQIKGCFSFEHAIDRTCKFVSKDTQRFAFVMLFLQPSQILLSGFVPAKEQRGRFRKGPCEVSVPNLMPSSVQAFAPGCLRTLDQATIRSAILHTGEASDLVHCVEPHETEDFANARHGLASGKGMGIVLLRGCEDSLPDSFSSHCRIVV